MTPQLPSYESLTASLLLMRRSIVVGGVLLIAVLVAANGIYILMSGRIGPPLTKLPRPRQVLPYPSRVAGAVLYLAVATGLVLLTMASVIADIKEVLLRQMTDIIIPVLMVACALIIIFRPIVLVRWAKRAHPDLPEDNKTALWMARIIGMGILGIGAFILVIIVRSFTS